MNIFVFDIETIPDVASGRKLYQLDELDDKEVADALFAKRRAETNGSDFLRLHLHQIVAISVVFRHRDTIKVWSLGDPDAPEKELIERFFAGIDRYSPTILSWNGGGFDLPVLHYRALLHGVNAGRYWETGNNDNDFRWNNYINRFHYRHLDLMDVLAGYQARANAPLDQIATMLGFPGKMGMDGSKIWDAYQNQQIDDIRNYCETDVLNTYLVYLRFELLRGNLLQTDYERECNQLRDYLKTEDKNHFTEFLNHWQDA